ncbi:MAG: hypothetical protein ACTSRA_03910 [Promethearchaeota archaeon]
MGDKVVRSFKCRICGVEHSVELPKDLLKDKKAFPFSYVFLHKIEKSDDIEEIGIDVLTTLYLDAELRIRGVELRKLVSSDIISKDDTAVLVRELVEEISRLQDENRMLHKEIESLKKFKKEIQ